MCGSVEPVQNTNGGHVVGAHNGRGQLVQQEQLLDGAHTALHRMVSFDDVFARNDKP